MLFFFFFFFFFLIDNRPLSRYTFKYKIFFFDNIELITGQTIYSGQKTYTSNPQYRYFCLFRCPHDVPLPAKVGGPAPHNPAQIHVPRRQDVPANLRVLPAPGEPFGRRDTPASPTRPTVRLHRTLPTVRVLLKQNEKKNKAMQHSADHYSTIFRPRRIIIYTIHRIPQLYIHKFTSVRPP